MTVQTLSAGPSPKVEVQNVGGDLVIEGWDRNEIEARSDDLHPVRQEGQSVSLSCGGDLNLSVPRGASLSLRHVGGDLSMANVTGAIELSFGGGNAKLQNLTGNVSVAGVMGNLQMQNVSNVSVEPMRGGVGADLSERIRNQLKQATQRAHHQAERAARQAERRIKQAERTASHARHAGGSFSSGLEMGRWKWGSAPVRAPNPVSDEERLVILKMLEEKKITSAEAEKLLAALEGGV